MCTGVVGSSLRNTHLRELHDRNDVWGQAQAVSGYGDVLAHDTRLVEKLVTSDGCSDKMCNA